MDGAACAAHLVVPPCSSLLCNGALLPVYNTGLDDGGGLHNYVGRAAYGDDGLAKQQIRRIYETIGNADVDRYNAHCLENAGDVSRHYTCDKISDYKDEQAYRDTLSKMANMNTKDVGGLPAYICLSVGKPYIITASIDVSDDLVNGNMGTLRYITHYKHVNLVRLWLAFPASAVDIVA
ncbi:hypothetical protein MRX96_059645 [Rhipicephalus microplus]